MTKEIEEGNKLIAEFMGADAEFNKLYRSTIYYEHNGEYIRYIDNLLFHTSWDWLMTVVGKIGDIDNMADVGFAAKLEKANLQIFETSILCHKQAVYERVIEFIKWYNEQHK